MKKRNLVILGLIVLISSLFIRIALAAPRHTRAPNFIYEVKLFDLKKRGSCDSTKYTITNIDSNPITTNHTFNFSAGLQVYEFESSIGPGETKTYDLAEMDGLPYYFQGSVTVTSAGEITGTKLDFPPCDISIECSLEFPIIGKINTPYTCTATVTPEDALKPITITWYAWNAETQDWHIIGIGDTVELSWTTGGWNQVIVIAQNSIGSVQVRLLILNDVSNLIFIPITIK
jgi:hypothetical protein